MSYSLQPGLDPIHVGASGRLAVGRPFKIMFFKFFFLGGGPGQGWRKLLKAPTQILDNFLRNSFTCADLSLLAPHLRLFH